VPKRDGPQGSSEPHWEKFLNSAGNRKKMGEQGERENEKKGTFLAPVLEGERIDQIKYLLFMAGFFRTWLNRRATLGKKIQQTFPMQERGSLSRTGKRSGNFLIPKI